eukprot:SAG31_NODE_1263_length_9072_cov_9.389390_5_plen_75_part_00
MVVKISVNTLSYSQEVAAGRMDMFDIIEELYRLRCDGISPAQQHFTEPEDDAYLERIKMAAVHRGLHMVWCMPT